MPVQPDDVVELLMKIRYDCTAIQAKVTDALKAVGALNLHRRPEAVCPRCGLEVAGPRTLAEHVRNSHDGPLPEHWAQADALVRSEQ